MTVLGDTWGAGRLLALAKKPQNRFVTTQATFTQRGQIAGASSGCEQHFLARGITLPDQGELAVAVVELA